MNPTVEPTDEEKRALEEFIAANYQPTKLEEIEEFVKKTYGAGRQRKDVTGEEVENIKQKIKQVGSLEFRILANQSDDRPVMDGIKKWYAEPKTKDILESNARKGLPPPVPPPPEGEKGWPNAMPPAREVGPLTYTWVEMSKAERGELGVHDDAAKASRS